MSAARGGGEASAPRATSAPRDVALPVADVVVLEDRARVVRRGGVTLAAGQHRLRVVGVAPVLVDKTVVARGAEGAEGVDVVDVRVVREVAPWLDDAPDPRAAAAAVAGLRDRLAEARRAARAAAAAATVAASDAASLAELVRVAHGELAEEAAWGRAATDAGPRLAELSARARAAAGHAAALAVDAARAGEEEARLARHVDERERALGREVAAVLIDVVAAAATTCELVVEYVTPCACWRPGHVATLRDGQIEVATDACVWQATGEDWREVRLAFSTERPSLGTTPPALRDDLLAVRPRGMMAVVAREQVIATTGHGAARALATELPGVDDGGVTRLLRAPLPASVPSDGRAYRVRLGAFTAPAEVAHVAMPEQAPAVFLRTRQVNAGTEPLLAGPVELLRDGGPCGRTSLLFVAPGERFVLGWGADPALRVHRDHREHHEASGMLGSWSTTRHRVAVRLSNLGPTARAVEVTERIPVSEVEQVEVALSPSEAWTLEDDDGVRRDPTPLCHARTLDRADGLVTWQVELPPRARRALALEYVVRTHDRVGAR